MYSHLFFITRGEATGGASIHVFEMARELKHTGSRPLVVHGSDSYSLSRLCTENNIDNLCVQQLQNSLSIFKDISALLQIYSLIKIYPNAKVILNSAKASFLGRLSCLLLGRKCLYIVHGWSYTGIFLKPSKAFYLLLELLAEILTLSVTYYIYVSYFDMARRPIPVFNRLFPCRSYVIHNGVDTIPKPPKPVHLSKYSSLPRILRLITVCRLDAQKDVSSLIKAVSCLDNVRLVIVGDGPFYESLMQTIHEHNCTSKVKLVGRQPREDLFHLLLNSDLFLLISNWEGFPISTVEAMSLGLPVIVSDVGGACEIFELEPSLSFGFPIHRSNSPVKIADAIRSYFDEYMLLAHSRNSYDVYCRHLTMKHMLSSYLYAYSLI